MFIFRNNIYATLPEDTAERCMLLCRIQNDDDCAFYVHDSAANECHLGNHDETTILTPDSADSQDAWVFKGKWTEYCK